MLEYLRIRDLALIENVELDFTSGMNVLTGETGAGKTFILKAIQFLLGEKLSTDLVRKGSEKAQVEAVFYIGEEEFMLRRELIAETSRSRFFLNDSLSSQEMIKELKSKLILHVGQHGQQRLLQTSFQGKIIDDFLKDKELLNQKNEVQKKLKAILAQKDELNSKIISLQDKRELLEMQKQEIERVDPKQGEEEKLENLRSQFKSNEHIKNLFDQSLSLIHGDGEIGLLTLLSKFEKVLEKLVKDELINNIDNAYQALITFTEEVKDLDKVFRQGPTNQEQDLDLEISLDDIESRLYALQQLKRKLNRSLEQILHLQTEITENLSFLDACSLDIIKLEKEEKIAVTELNNILFSLNTAREEAAHDFCKALQEELKGLGFSDKVAVIPEFNSHVIYQDESNAKNSPSIEKTVKLLWAPNPGQTPQALDKIASGGELSRFLLAVIGLQKSQFEDATLIFDEVDSGVGGITLNRVADRLSELAEKRQMLLITHWPQLAARAKNHFFISKEFIDNTTYSRCIRLNEKAKQKELLRMSGEE